MGELDKWMERATILAIIGFIPWGMIMGLFSTTLGLIGLSIQLLAFSGLVYCGYKMWDYGR